LPISFPTAIGAACIAVKFLIFADGKRAEKSQFNSGPPLRNLLVENLKFERNWDVIYSDLKQY
jgi:hypothetical protein